MLINPHKIPWHREQEGLDELKSPLCLLETTPHITLGLWLFRVALAPQCVKTPCSLTASIAVSS